MKAFKVASLRSTEPRAMQLAARELGHGLQTRSPAELASIRGQLAAIKPEPEPEGAYAQGFRDAIEHILAGLSAEAKHRAAVAEDVTAANVRKNAAKVLLALNSGDELAKDITKKTGLTIQAVSTELGELEREDLVERLEPRAGEDQRTAPRALTIRGARLAQALSHEAVSPAAQAARDLAPVFVAFINTLSDQSFLPQHRLQAIAVERFGTASGAFVCDEFLRHAERQRVVSRTDSVLTLTSLDFGLRLSDVLQTALLSSTPPPVFEQIKRLTSSGHVCIRATTRMRNQWQVAFSKLGMRNVHAWCLDDAMTEQLPKHGPYHIVWENPGVLSKDLGDASIVSFIESAVERRCYAAPDTALPPGIERLDYL